MIEPQRAEVGRSRRVDAGAAVRLEATLGAVGFRSDAPLEVFLDGVVRCRVLRKVAAHRRARRDDLAATTARLARFARAVASQLRESQLRDGRFLQAQARAPARRLHFDSGAAVALADLVHELRPRRRLPRQPLARERHRERLCVPRADLIQREVGRRIRHGQDGDDIVARLQPSGDAEVSERARTEAEALVHALRGGDARSRHGCKREERHCVVRVRRVVCVCVCVCVCGQLPFWDEDAVRKMRWCWL